MTQTIPTPTLIAIDTAGEICSVALAREGRVVESSEEVGHRHSERVLPMLGALLDEHDSRLGDCDAIAFGAGPGAFTGLRIACGVAQGLAYGLRKSVLPIGNLDALAENARRLRPHARRIFAAVDARMNEAYWAVFDIVGERLRECAPPALARADELPLLLEEWRPELMAGNAFSVFTAALSQGEADNVLATARAGAASVAALAVHAWHEGKAIEPALAAPVYVRNRVAQTVAERRAMRPGAEA